MSIRNRKKSDTPDTELETKTKTRDENIDNISKKIERKEFLEKELNEFPNRISNCKDNDELEELSKAVMDYQNELTELQNEETRAGMSFKQRRYEAEAIKAKDTYDIERLVEALKGKQKEFLGRQKLAQNRLLNAKKNTSLEDKAIFRENLNNVNMGVINLETKIKELEQTVVKLKAEELMELKKRQKELQEQSEKIRGNFPMRSGDEDGKAHNKNLEKWREDFLKVQRELQNVNKELAKIEAENNGMPSE